MQEKENLHGRVSVDQSKFSHIVAQQAALAKYQEDLDKREIEHSDRVKQIEAHFAKRISSLERREKEAQRQQERIESLQEKLQKERGIFHEMAKQREDELSTGLTELEAERKKYLEEASKKIQQKSEKYVAQALEFLGAKEKRFHRYSAAWSIIGAISIVTSILVAAWATIQFVPIQDALISWQFLFFVSLKGLILVGLALALARYSFLLSTRYMKEALRNAERRHAIQFGAFYLDSYGAAADWTQVKEAFKDWNISLSSESKMFPADGIQPASKEEAGHIAEDLIVQLKKLSDEFTKISSSITSAIKKD